MRSILLFSALFIWASAELAAQGANCPRRYRQRVFNSVQVYRDVVFSKDAPKLLTASLGIETTWNTDLVMDIYMPPPTDTVTQRPVVVLAHGGGFVNVAFMGGTVLVGTKDNEDVQALADTLAHWGYVAASIEYRTGFDVLSGTSIKRAVWRGSQDVSAAIRFFRKNRQWFGIDPNRVFVGGSSAGAFASLHATFVDGNERIPESLEQTPIVMPDLGALHSRPVVELTGFNPFTGTNVLGNDVDSIAQGVVGYWGAIADPAMLTGNNQAPTIMFHGTDDIVVDAECAQPFSSLILVAPVTCGSIVMDSAMTAIGLQHETYIEQGEGHEYWGVLNGDWLPSGPNAYWYDMIEKTSLFFNKIMRPATPQISGASAAQPQSIQTYSIVNPQPNMRYCWEAVNGTVVGNPPATANSIQVLWSAQQGLGSVRVSAIDVAEAVSLQRVYNVNININAIGVEEIGAASAPILQIMPNPVGSSSSLRLQWLNANESSQPTTIRLFDLSGRLAYSTEIAAFDLAAGAFISLPTLPSGIYSLHWQQDGARGVQKLAITE